MARRKPHIRIYQIDKAFDKFGGCEATAEELIGISRYLYTHDTPASLGIFMQRRGYPIIGQRSWRDCNGGRRSIHVFGRRKLNDDIYVENQ